MNETTIPKGNVQAAFDELGKRAHVEFLVDNQTTGERGAPIIVLPPNVTHKSLKPILDEYLERPERMHGHAQLTDIESLAAYVNLYKRPESLVFLDDRDADAPCVHVVFDAHQPNSLTLDADEGPGAGWNQFGAKYNFPLTAEWVAWRDIAGKWLEQGQFAAFIEEHLLDVADPSDPGERAAAIAKELGLTLAGRAKLFELSRGLQVNVSQNLTNAVNLASGEGQLFFEEKHADDKGQMLRIPGAFAIAIPVFRGAGSAYRMIVMLRYRASDKRVKWQLSPHLIETVFEDALAGAAAEIRTKTSIPVLRGAPR